jgi:hypothetical protein
MKTALKSIRLWDLNRLSLLNHWSFLDC